MNTLNYKRVLIGEIKRKGYKHNTVRGKNGGEIPLEDVSVGQLQGIKYGLIKAMKKEKRKVSN